MNWSLITAELRAQVLELSHRANAAHLASSLSCLDILAVLYESVLRFRLGEPQWEDRDRFILSKGHAAAALYAVMARQKILSDQDLLGYGQQGSLLEEHPSPYLTTIEAATGSLGHGLPIANGMALGAKIQQKHFRVFVVMSDGECNEGSTWEAAMFAGRHQMQNLCAVVDFNKWQATGRSTDVLALEPLVDKWRAFGWDAKEVDGHDHILLEREFNSDLGTRPKILIAHTVKGKGISFMEDDNNWHYRIPTREEIIAARIELGLT